MMAGLEACSTRNCLGQAGGNRKTETMCMGADEKMTPEEARAWSQRMGVRVRTVADLVHNAGDASNLLAAACRFLAPVLPESWRPRLDTLVVLGADCWNSPPDLLRILRLVERFVSDLKSYCPEVARSTPDRVAEFGAGVMFFGGWGQAIAARATALTAGAEAAPVERLDVRVAINEPAEDAVRTEAAEAVATPESLPSRGGGHQAA
jgi:hypothetical protein